MICITLNFKPLQLNKFDIQTRNSQFLDHPVSNIIFIDPWDGFSEI